MAKQNYFSMQKQLMKLLETAQLDITKTSMLHALLMHWNSQGRPDVCPIDSKILRLQSGIKNAKTYYKCLQELAELGYIEYTKGASSKAPATFRLTLETIPASNIVPDTIVGDTIVPDTIVTIPADTIVEQNTPYSINTENTESITVATSENEKPPAKKRRTQATEFDKEAAEAFAQLFEEHLGRPVKKSADTIRKMRTVDKIPEEQIREAYTYLKNRGKAGQYQCVVLSFKALREKFTKLQAEMQRKNQAGTQLTIQQKMEIRAQKYMSEIDPKYLK